MPHNNQQQDHVARLVRPTPTSAAGARAAAPFPFRGIALPQGPPEIYRSATAPTITAAAPGAGGALFTVYVPSGAHGNPGAPPLHVVHYGADAEQMNTYSTTRSDVTSTAPSLDEETAATTKHGNHSATASFDSQHEVAHSVLLLASKAREEAKRKTSDSPTASPSSERIVPFKKRKMAAVEGIIRSKQDQSQPQKQQEQQQKGFRVSPVPSHVNKMSGGTTTPSPDRSGASQGSSFEEGAQEDELENGQALPDSAKVVDSINVAPLKTVTVPHFPSQLYELLSPSSSSEQDDNKNNHNKSSNGVLQWCSNGKAWRIVRWDALRKTVLPQHFGAGATLDSFLSEVSAWGFVEITNGIDAGAYCHTLFRRGFPNLCKEIQRICTTPSHTPPSHQMPARSNVATPRILQVPSLVDATHMGCGSISEEDATFATRSPKTPKTTISHRAESAISPTSSTHHTAHTRSDSGTASISSWGMLHPQTTHVYMPYCQHPEQSHSPLHHPHLANSYQQPAHPQASVWLSAVSTVDAAPTSTTTTTLPAYSPVRIRSGRGAARLPAPRLPVQVTPNPSRRGAAPIVESSSTVTATTNIQHPAVATTVTTTITPKPTYPRVVSNRGRRRTSAMVASAPMVAAAAAGAFPASYQLVEPSPLRSALKQTIMTPAAATKEDENDDEDDGGEAPAPVAPAPQ